MLLHDLDGISGHPFPPCPRPAAPTDRDLETVHRRFIDRLHKRRETAGRQERERVLVYDALTRADVGRGISPSRFDAAVDLLSLGPACRHYERRLKGLADGLARQGFVERAAAPGDVPGQASREGRLLLLDRGGQPRAAFLPDVHPQAARRESLAAELDELLQARHGLSLGFVRPVPHQLPGHGSGSLIMRPHPPAEVPPPGEAPARALQISALAGLFTNNWWAGWSGQRLDGQGRRWHLDADAAFPDPDLLRAILRPMQQAIFTPPLFRKPVDAGDVWHQPFDAGLLDRIAEIDTDGLEAALLSRLDGASGDATLRPAIRQAIRAMKTVQERLAQAPATTLSQLLLFYPGWLDWVDDPADVPTSTAAQVGRSSPVARTGDDVPLDSPLSGRVDAPKKPGLRRRIARFAGRCRDALLACVGRKPRGLQGAPDHPVRNVRPSQNERPGAGS